MSPLETIALAMIFAAFILVVVRVNQWHQSRWHLKGSVMRRKVNGRWETRPATSADKDEDWSSRQL